MQVTGPAQLQFLGGAGTVTGSKFLVETDDARVLVDCGLFQGGRELRQRNWDRLAVPADTVDAVVLTHAHLDHCGYLPVLVDRGFQGPVLATEATRDLARIVLTDSGRLHEEEAGYRGRRGFSRHHPPLPLYTELQAEHAADRIVGVPFATPVSAATGIEARFRPAGHILGSAFVELDVGGRRVVFSGDLGQPRHPLLAPPGPLGACHVVVVESTYGDRVHEDESADLERLARALTRMARAGGVCVIPAFAVDRTEVLLHVLGRLTREGRIPKMSVFADSPMALAVLDVYRKALAGDADGELRPVETTDPFDLDGELREMATPEQSRSLNEIDYPCIIVSASGMATGGRVLHHLARRLPDGRNLVVLPGYQAIGTRGRALADHERMVRLFGKYVPVRADVLQLGAFSAHADADELLAWLRTAPSPPEIVYVVHGEPEASDALAGRILEELDVPAVVPRHLERVRLD